MIKIEISGDLKEIREYLAAGTGLEKKIDELQKRVDLLEKVLRNSEP